jgi:tRNA (adenine57-N1/adenine58-N1)-methyltransferase
VRPLEAGERVLLQDVKGRRYLITLEQGATFHTHKGRLAHDQLIGSAEGVVARTDLGQKLLVLRPTLADWVVKRPRGAQVIYPKVLALMVMAADVQPGLTVAEAGTGSGALSIALLQALAPGGRLHSFERRPDFADQARRNVERWFGKAPDGFELHAGDVVDGIADLGPLDRVLLDLLEPWLVVPGAAAALRPGGLLVSFVATVPQVMRLVEALESSGRFGLVETSEAIFRPWHVDGLAVRPEHRMIGHTGFLVSARRVDGPWPAPGRAPLTVWGRGSGGSPPGGGDAPVATDDKLRNEGQDLKGKAKETIGRATDDEELEAQGRTDQTKASLKDAGEKVKDAIKDA